MLQKRVQVIWCENILYTFTQQCTQGVLLLIAELMSRPERKENKRGKCSLPNIDIRPSLRDIILLLRQ